MFIYLEMFFSKNMFSRNRRTNSEIFISMKILYNNFINIPLIIMQMNIFLSFYNIYSTLHLNKIYSIFQCRKSNLHFINLKHMYVKFLESILNRGIFKNIYIYYLEHKTIFALLLSNWNIKGNVFKKFHFSSERGFRKKLI